MPSLRASLLHCLALGVVGGLASCSSGSGDTDTEPFDFGDVDTMVDLGDVAFDVPEPDRCIEVERLTAVRMRSAPGGRQLHVSLTDSEGRALESGFVTCLSLEDSRLGPLPLVHSVAPAGAGATLIVARWTPSEWEASRAFIDDFVAQRPSDERIAVWAWSDELVQVVGATTDRDALERRLDATWSSDPAPPASADRVGVDAAEAWERLSEGALLGPRSIVFVAPDHSLETLPDIDRDFVTDFWVLSSDQGARQFVGSDSESLADAAAEIAATIDTVYDSGLSVLAFCDDGGALEVSMTSADEVIRRVRFGDAAQEHVGAGCELQRILDAGPPDTMRFDLSFTEEERGRFDRMAADRNSAAVWDGAITLEGDVAATTFEGSFRGRSSLGCERKSMSINLDGNDRRHALAHSGTDEFFLVSMCLDNRYVNQLNADQLLGEFGLWELEFGTAEVRIDGESRGVYLFIEEIDQELRNDRSRLRAVIRRRTDIDDKPADVEFAAEDAGAALARYDAFLASFDGLEGDALLDALRSKMDIDQYFRWVALMTLLGNGDYIDEVFFIAEESVDENHEVTDYYTVHAWDPDDLFSACHHNGRFAIDDPNGLLYCTESVLDHLIFADATVYSAYAVALQEVIESLTVERFTATAEATRDGLLTWFEDDDIREAMVELLEANPEAVDAEVAASEIADATTNLIANFETSRSELLAALEAYWDSE